MFGGVVQAQSVDQPFSDDGQNPTTGEENSEQEEEQSYNVIKDLGGGVQVVDTSSDENYIYVTVRSENTEVLIKNYIVGKYFNKEEQVTVRGNNQTTEIRFDSEKYPTIKGMVLGYEEEEGVFNVFVIEDVNRSGNIFPPSLSGLLGWVVGLSFGIGGVIGLSIRKYRSWRKTETVIFNYD